MRLNSKKIYKKTKSKTRKQKSRKLKQRTRKFKGKGGLPEKYIKKPGISKKKQTFQKKVN